MILVTGAAGFIGYHLAERLLDRGEKVLGLDDLNAYYDVRLKEARLTRLHKRPGFQFVRQNLADRGAAEDLFLHYPIRSVVHLAAQVGVRHSVTHPHAFMESNLIGFLNVLEGCRHARVGHFVYASSSSVYGANSRLPFSTEDVADRPVSLYGATKRSNELMAYSYAHLYGLPCSGARLFTVYGPWGRPDMALFLFTRSILEGRPIPLFNGGRMTRDFTYVGDIVEGLVRVLDRPAGNGGAVPWQVFNIGNHQGVSLLHLIRVLEDALGKKAEFRLMPAQLGDIPDTCADVSDLEAAVGFKPQTPVEVGVPRFVAWYREFYQTTTSPPVGPALSAAALASAS